MNKRLALAALAAALALPAAGADAPRAERPFDNLKKFDFDFNFDFDFDSFELLADASAIKAHAELAAEHVRSWAENFTHDLQGSMAYMFSDRVARGKVVKGAPYSAEVVSETIQTLTDGNVITHKTRSRVFRDGEGRTRQETYSGDAVRSIYISDPVAGTSYTLLPGSRIAVSVPRLDRLAPRAEKEKMSGEGRSSDTERRVVVRTVEGKEGMPGSREEVRVQVIRVGDGDGRDVVIQAPVAPRAPVPPTPPIPPVAAHAPLAPISPSIPGVHTMRFESTARLGKGVTSTLPARDFDGIKAEGKSTVWTIAAGEIGNRNPIKVTSESWYSPDLQVTVYSRHSDPRTGESIYRLAAIKRAEPAADLFKVPEGYTLKGRREKRDAPEPRR